MVDCFQLWTQTSERQSQQTNDRDWKLKIWEWIWMVQWEELSRMHDEFGKCFCNRNDTVDSWWSSGNTKLWRKFVGVFEWADVNSWITLRRKMSTNGVEKLQALTELNWHLYNHPSVLTDYIWNSFLTLSVKSRFRRRLFQRTQSIRKIFRIFLLPLVLDVNKSMKIKVCYPNLHNYLSAINIILQGLYLESKINQEINISVADRMPKFAAKWSRSNEIFKRPIIISVIWREIFDICKF